MYDFDVRNGALKITSLYDLTIGIPNSTNLEIELRSTAKQLTSQLHHDSDANCMLCNPRKLKEGTAKDTPRPSNGVHEHYRIRCDPLLGPIPIRLGPDG